MKATTLLERQHRNIQQLCEAIEGGSPRVRESLLPQLASDLAAHMEIEEKLFFPAVRVALGEPMARLAESACHTQTRGSLDAILDTSPWDATFETRVTELRAALERQFHGEEELIFPRLEHALSANENRALGERMMSLHHVRVEAGYPHASVGYAATERLAASSHAHRSR